MTQSNPQNEAVVMTFFKLLDGDDFEGMRSLLTEDATWVAQASELPGEFRGRDAIVDELLKPYSALFEVKLANTMLSMASNGPLVFAETRGKGLLRDGREYQNSYAWAIEVRDGQVAAIREYLDTQYVVSMFGNVSLSDIAARVS